MCLILKVKNHYINKTSKLISMHEKYVKVVDKNMYGMIL